jgi:RNA polymerase sporulation-specific sigma factor
LITAICSENKGIPKFSRDANDIEILRSMEPQKRRDCLITNNMRLAISVAQKFGYEEDYESVAMIGLIRAADTFDLDKGACFSTYAARVVQNQILMYLRKCKRQIQAISFETVVTGTEENLTVKDTLSYEDDQLMRLEQAEQIAELYKVVHSLPDRECEIICLLYGFGDKSHTQKEVAERLSLSQSYISRLEKSILKKMKSMLKNHR